MKLIKETPKGDITVIQKADEEYTGLVISINGQEVAMVEYNPHDDHHAIYVWGDNDPDGECVHKEVYKLSVKKG